MATRKVDTWMPLLVDRYLGDTTHLTTEQHGAYLLLLMAMWKRDGTLPADESQLSNVVRMTPQRWKANRTVLLQFFDRDGDTLTQKRLSVELANSKRMAEAKTEAGAKGATKRWQTHGKRMAEPLANEVPKQSQTDASISLSIHHPTDGDTPLPPSSGLPEWLPPDAWLDFEQFRKEIRKPLTGRGRELIIAKLAAFRSVGNDPRAVIEQSIANGWQGVFAVKPAGSVLHGKQAALEARNAAHAAEFSRRIKEQADAAEAQGQ